MHVCLSNTSASRWQRHATVDGNVFGGGNESPSRSNTEVIIKGDVEVTKDVFGGGNIANVDGSTTVGIQGGTVLTDVYGGGALANTGNTTVNLSGGTIVHDVYGGGLGQKTGFFDATSDVEALVNGNTLVELNKNTATDNCVVMGSIFGCNNRNGTPTGTVLVHVYKTAGNGSTNVRTPSDKLFSPTAADHKYELMAVYGGGNEAPIAGNIQIKLGCITSLSEIYGGARLANVGSADKNCDVVLNITSGHFDRVFGGNNIDGIIYGSITVNIEETGCHPITIGELYGCGNQARYTTPAGKADPTINVKSFTSIGRIFGGGLGAGAVVTGNPTININETLGDNALQTSDYAGTTRTLSDGSTVDLPAHTSGEMGVIGSVFGGGNAAKVDGNTTVNIGTQMGESIVFVTPETATEAQRTKTVLGVDIKNNVFGGGNKADVTGKTNVKIGKEN